MHIRIQTWGEFRCSLQRPPDKTKEKLIGFHVVEGTAPVEALEKGLDDLMDLCDVVSEKFEAAKHDVEGNGQPRRRG
jgi:DNA-directed RNA polymerases I and III subunit RPAC2